MAVVVPILVCFVPSNTPPRWLAPALMVGAFIAFVVVGTRRLVGEAHLVLALLAAGATAACAPFLGVDTVRVFAATAPFAALPVALAVAVVTRAGRPSPPATPSPAPRLPRPSPPTPSAAGARGHPAPGPRRRGAARGRSPPGNRWLRWRPARS